MDYLRLLVALLLPWFGGYLWLAALEKYWQPGKTNTLRQIGYGLFLGYAAVQGLVLSASYLTGRLPFWPILAMVALITICGAVLHRRSGSVCSNTQSHANFLPQDSARILFCVLLAWASLHLVLVAIEILYRPVFPWDAWFNWTYRAKAWFYSGQVAPLDLPADWLKGDGTALYNVDGNHYPSFPSTLALWSAMALGHWSETLVNLPVLLCGTALVLALYGQCREVGMAPWLSVLCAYMLISIPLVGTHLSLAGQADIWMTGFTGLGFVALLHGLTKENRLQIFLGLAMAAMGIATKLEGAVWFLAALLVAALACRPGLTLATIAIGTVFIAMGWLVGVTYLEIPFVGGMGLANEQLHIPFLGSYELKAFDLWDDYWANFFEQGSWHLLWTLILLSAVCLWLVPAKPVRRALLAFYSVTLLAQLFIFEGTESGRWAQDWTAINRLPLHFAPALVFSMGVLVTTFLESDRIARVRYPDFRATALGLIITIAGTLVYLVLTFPSKHGSSYTFKSADMRIVVGGGQRTGDSGLIEKFENNIAILSSGPLQLNTEDVELLRADTQASGQAPVKFFWRTGNGPEDLQSIEIDGGGSSLIDLNEFASWQGMVNELGIIFYSDDGKHATFQGLELLPDSWTLQLSKLVGDWSETSRWSQKSVNWISAGAMNSAVPLPLVMTVWIASTLLLSTVLIRTGRGHWSSVVFCSVVAWLVLDLRWTTNRLQQAADTVTSYPLIMASSLDFGNDAITRQLVETARPYMEEKNARTVIMGEDRTLRFQVLRAKYQALPAPVYAHIGAWDSTPSKLADYILVIRKQYVQPGQPRPTPASLARMIEAKTGLRVTIVWNKPEGFLLSVANKIPPVRAANQAE